MLENDLVVVGTKLYEEFRKKVSFSSTGVDYPNMDLQDAYQIQKAYTGLRASTEGGFAGYKIAYSTKVMQERIGAKEPVYGRIFSDGVMTSPAGLQRDDFVRLGIECEVAIRVGRPLDELNRAPFTRDEVFDAIDSLSIAFEIIDTRSSLTEASLQQQTATNISGSGVVLGEPVKNWQNANLESAKCELTLDGQSVGTGYGADVNGHPTEPLYWLANALHRAGTGLRKGDIVITGSMIAPQMLDSATTAVLEMDHLGSILLNVE